MNKIILLSEREELAKGALKFASMLNRQQAIALTGVFLPRETYNDILFYYSLGPVRPVPYSFDETLVLQADQAINDFRDICRQESIEHEIHRTGYEDLKADLKKETRFADLMLITKTSSFNSYDEMINNEYVKDSMHFSECPVIVVPEHFDTVSNVILAYDGSASSVYAIRQFAVLMPGLAHLDTLLVYIDPDESKEIPDRKYIEDLISRHFSKIKILKVEINPKKYFTTWLADRPDTMLVTGAYGHTGLSEMFHKSFVGDVLKENNVPVFIAHR